jgi:hypothetical protein
VGSSFAAAFYWHIFWLKILFGLSLIGIPFLFLAGWIYAVGLKKNRKWIRQTAIIALIYGIISFLFLGKCGLKILGQKNDSLEWMEQENKRLRLKNPD